MKVTRSFQQHQTHIKQNLTVDQGSTFFLLSPAISHVFGQIAFGKWHDDSDVFVDHPMVKQRNNILMGSNFRPNLYFSFPVPVFFFQIRHIDCSYSNELICTFQSPFPDISVGVLSEWDIAVLVFICYLGTGGVFHFLILLHVLCLQCYVHDGLCCVMSQA